MDPNFVKDLHLAYGQYRISPDEWAEGIEDFQKTAMNLGAGVFRAWLLQTNRAGVKGIFLSDDFISVNKEDSFNWEDLKHIIISFINDYFAQGNENVISKMIEEKNLDTSTVEGQIIKILETKIRPAVARDGGDIKFKEFKDGIVRVELQGACSGCPSAALTLKQGVQNLLCHYIPEVREVEAI